MKYSLILVLLTMTGCSTLVPVRATWPEVPKEITEACPQLSQLPNDTKKLSDVVGNVSGNYGTYYECQAKHEAWVEWYKKQKQIYENVK